MSQMPSLNFNDLARLLKNDGWEFVANGTNVGSHKHLVHPVKPGKVTLDDYHDFSVNIVRDVLKAAGLTNAFKKLQQGTPLRVVTAALARHEYAQP